ncbi:MAG: hypothetical protein RL657_397 [Pseudomonadota bacterium]
MNYPTRSFLPMSEADRSNNLRPDAVPAFGASEQQILRWLARAHGADVDPVQAHFNRAQAQVLLQRWDGALASLDVVIGLSPEHVQAHQVRLSVLERLNRR